MAEMLIDKFKRYLITFIILILTLQTTFSGSLFKLEKAKATSSACTASVVINEIMPNPAAGNTGNEWVEIFNNSNCEADISSWYIKDGNNFTFDEVVPANTYLTPYSFYIFEINAPNSLLGNSGDTVNLFNAFGTIVDSHTYIQADAIVTKSIARLPNGTGAFVANQIHTKGALNNLDITTPTSQITYPLNNYYYNSLGLITGIAEDSGGAGIDYVDIKIKRNSDNSYFNGAGWDTNENWLRTAGTYNWTYFLDNSYLTNGDNYTITSKAMDITGNPESCPTVTFYYDTEKPTGSIIINDGADATNGEGDYAVNFEVLAYPRVKLNFTYDDGAFTPSSDGGFGVATPVQPIQMKISNYPDMSTDPDARNTSAGQWITYTGEKEPWYLTDGDGQKSVYVQFKDKAGNISSIYSDTIFYSQYNSGEERMNISNGGPIIYSPFADGSVEMAITANSPTILFYSTYSEKPVSSNSGINFLGKYYDFSVADTSAINFPVLIKIYFTEADLDAAGITKDQIQGLFYWDFSTSSWKLYPGSSIKNSDKPGYAGYVETWVEHFTPMSIGGDVTAPEKPANFRATAGNEEVTLNWDKTSDAAGYYVRYRKATSNDNDPYTTIFLTGGDTTETKITGLTNDVEYEFGVASKDSAGNVSEYAVVVQTPKYSAGSKIHTESSLKGYFIGTAMAADSSSGQSNQNDQVTDNSAGDENVNSDNQEENGINWTRFLVTLGIILLAAGAGFGGYYGYQWWMGSDEEEEKKEEKKPNKKNKRDNRW